MHMPISCYALDFYTSLVKFVQQLHESKFLHVVRMCYLSNMNDHKVNYLPCFYVHERESAILRRMSGGGLHPPSPIKSTPSEVIIRAKMSSCCKIKCL